MNWRNSIVPVIPRTRFLRGVALLALAALLSFGNLKAPTIPVPPTPETSVVVPAQAPHILMTQLPSITDDKILHVAYQASDDLGIAQISLRVTPRNPLPGAEQEPVDIPLSTVEAKHISRSDLEDLSLRSWSGDNVFLQIVATNTAGITSITDPVSLTLPERRFFHPIARVLIEERKKLLEHPDDEKLRNEAANIMAGIAHQTINYHGDPVVLMALRSGAVRLVLNNDHATAVSVNDILWEAATRIEDGSANEVQHTLLDATQDLSSLQDF